MNHTANRKAQATLAVLFVLSVAFITAGTASATSVIPRYQYLRYGFDQGLAPWEGAIYYDPAHMTPSDDTYPVLKLGGSAKNSYAQLSNRGGKAVWMYAGFRATASLLHVSFEAIPVYGSWSMIPIVYVGKQAPNGLIGFQKLGNPLDQGRQSLAFMVDLHQAGLQGGTFVIALGYLNTDSAQLKQFAGIDNVRIVIDDGE